MLINDYKKDFCPRVLTGEVQQGRWSSKDNMHMLASVVSLNYAFAT